MIRLYTLYVCNRQIATCLNVYESILTHIGLLSAPGDITINQDSCSSLEIFWKEPFSLPEVPITGNIINLTQFSSSDGNELFSAVFYDVNTTHVIAVPDHVGCQLQEVCSKFFLSIAAMNGAGTGEYKAVTFSSVSGLLLIEMEGMLHAHEI